MKQWIMDIFVYAGVSREEYKNIKSAIRYKNAGILICSTIIAGALLAALFFMSFVSPTIQANRPLYGSVLGATLCLLAFELGVIQKHERFTLVGCYVFAILVYGFAITLGTVLQPQIPATTICVLLFAVPLMFTDQPYRFNTLLIVVALSFCHVSFRVKSYEVANLDEVNIISFLVLGIVVNTYMQRTKIRELAQRNQIEYQRDTDALTRLMTRAAVEGKIQTYMKRTTDPAALLVLDIDDFKGINDTWGHAYGDAILRIMGECIKNIFQDVGICGRYGGDEFLVFLPNIENYDAVIKRIEDLTSLMKDRLDVPEKSRQIHGSIGIACYPADAKEYKELFEKADEALYTSKAKGKDCYTFYFDQNILEK